VLRYLFGEDDDHYGFLDHFSSLVQRTVSVSRGIDTTLLLLLFFISRMSIGVMQVGSTSYRRVRRSSSDRVPDFSYLRVL